MSFESIKKSFKRAERVDGDYQLRLSQEDFFDLVDTIDTLEEQKKTVLHRVSAKTVLKILREAA